MSIASKYVLHGIAVGANFISQIENARVSPEAEILIDHPAGLNFPLNVANIRVLPVVTFDTPQLATVLGLGGNNGVTLIDLSASNVDLYFKRTSNLAARALDASNVHQRYRAAMACLSVDRLSASQGQPARASCTLYCLFNGASNPLIATGSQSLVGTPTAADRWTLGPTSITDTAPATVTIAGIQDWSLDFQRRVRVDAGDGEQFATHAFEESISPIITARGFDMLMPTISSQGVELTDVTSYLRRSDTVSPYANNLGQHIKIVGDAGIVTVDEASGGQNEGAMTALRMTIAATSASVPAIVITPGSTIN